jgi:hypothetical protein
VAVLLELKCLTVLLLVLPEGGRREGRLRMVEIRDAV